MSSPWLAHHFLIAMPAMVDPQFAGTVTYLVAHDPEHAFGLVINRPSGMLLNDVLEQMDVQTALPEVAAQPVWNGGPVHPERGLVLHETTARWDSTMEVTPELMLTTSRDVLIAMAEGRGPRRALVALGHAGWGPGQLEQELLANAWLTVPASPELLFQVPAEERWQRAMGRLGVDPHRLTGYAGHA